MSVELLIGAAVLRCCGAAVLGYCGAAAFDSQLNVENSKLESPLKEMINGNLGAAGMP